MLQRCQHCGAPFPHQSLLQQITVLNTSNMEHHNSPPVPGTWYGPLLIYFDLLKSLVKEEYPYTYPSTNHGPGSPRRGSTRPGWKECHCVIYSLYCVSRSTPSLIGRGILPRSEGISSADVRERRFPQSDCGTSRELLSAPAKAKRKRQAQKHDRGLDRFLSSTVLFPRSSTPGCSKHVQSDLGSCHVCD